jgi:TolB protein
VQRTTKGEVWLMPNGNAEAARSVASTVGRLYGHALAWTNNGQIVLSSLAGKNLALWLIDPAGSRSTQLTSNQGDYYTPTTSPDGRFIVFASNRNGSGLNIWRMNAEDGSDVKQLTFTTGNSYPSVSPDSHWVVYDNQSDANSPVTAWKVPIDGGDPVHLTDQSARMPIVSPDGRFIACRQLGENGSREIVILPFDGGSSVERLSIPVKDFQQIEWAPNGRALVYIDSIKGVSNLWSFDLATRATKQLTHSKSDQDQIFSYAWSRDRKQLACLRVNETRDVMTITNEK